MSNTMFEEFFENINLFLSNFAETYDLPKVLTDFKPLINRENGSTIRGDFSINFVSPKFHLWHKYLPQIAEQLVSVSSDWQTFSVKNCRIKDKICRIILFVCRRRAVPYIIQSFSQILVKNSMSAQNCHIICFSSEVKNRFTAERIRKVSQSVSKLMASPYVEFDYKTISEELFENLLSSAQNSNCCESDANNKLLFLDKSDATDTTGYVNHILIEKSSKSTFELIWNLHELVKNEPKLESNDTLIIVISESLCHRFRQSFRLMCLLYDLKLNLKLLTVSNVNTNQDFDDYSKTLSDSLMEQNDSSFQSSENFEIIIETSITLSLLSTSCSSLISNLDPHLNESTFIQYNCARLKAIINRYYTEFEDSSSRDSLDLSLLTHDLEWSLVLNQFSNYYSIINSLNKYFHRNSAQKALALNQLILFLKGFVSEVSVYYKKVKVLTEPSPHLLSLIAVRIYFCKILLNLFVNCLNILGLKTVEKL